MDITQGKSGAETIENAAERARNGAAHAVDSAKHQMQRAGYEVNSFVHRRPIETALLSAAAACVITGLAFWLSRPD